MSAFTDILNRPRFTGERLVAAQINAALTEVGFMCVTNHGIDQRVFERSPSASCPGVFPYARWRCEDEIGVVPDRPGHFNGLGRAFKDGAEHPDDKEFFQIGPSNCRRTDPEVLAEQANAMAQCLAGRARGFPVRVDEISRRNWPGRRNGSMRGISRQSWFAAGLLNRDRYAETPAAHGSDVLPCPHAGHRPEPFRSSPTFGLRLHDVALPRSGRWALCVE